jgi:prepilin-type N-terminal cleavage/methylation domain-containing protein
MIIDNEPVMPKNITIHSVRQSLKYHCAGFTLVEVAIVMVVVGIFVGLGAGMIGPLTKRMKTTETKETVNSAVEAIIGFSATNTRLPTAAQFPSILRSVNDSWNKPLRYSFDNNLTTLQSICSRTTTNITVTNGGTAYNNIAFVIMSSGPNYNNQTTGGGAGPAAIITYSPGTSNIDGFAGDFSRLEEYDDIVKWVTLPELQTKIGCATWAFEVWNSGALAYFRVNGGVACIPVAANTVISSLMAGGTINGFADAACTISAGPSSIAYSEAAAIDTNGDHRINYNKTNR